MSDFCPCKIAKQGEESDKKAKLSIFFLQWPNLDEFVDDIFVYLYKSSSYGNPEVLPNKARRKKILKSICTSKKNEGYG